MTVGGMILGPLVQKSAFGEYWTGFPFGGDFTDNKMLIMWIVWALALAVIGFKPKKKEKISRAAVLTAAVVMTVVYLIPHSMGGSTLDYDKVDKGIDPKEAIKTGGEE
jgi:Na+/melibiose symporter-like transporter